MKCVNCGADLGQDDKFCGNCGAQVKKEENNNEGVNQNMFMYDRTEGQNINYNQQSQMDSFNNRQQPQQYGQPNQQGKNMNDIIKICVLTIIALALLGGIVFGMYKMFTAFFNDEKKVAQNNNYSNVNDNIYNNNKNEADSGENNNGTLLSNNNSTYKVNYSGFNWFIPDDLMYQIDYSGDTLIIGDTYETWVAQLKVLPNVSIEKLEQNKNQLVAMISQTSTIDNVIIGTPSVENIGDKKFIILECEYSGVKMIIGYAGLNSMNTLAFQILNDNNDYNREYLTRLSEILESAEYTGESKYMEIDEGINIKEIIEATQKAIKE